MEAAASLLRAISSLLQVSFVQAVLFFPPWKLCTVVPQTAQVPFNACLPFFIVTSWGSFISVFFLHLTQYASVISSSFRSLMKHVLAPYEGSRCIVAVPLTH